MTCTWDPSNVGSNITLSDSDLTWTSTSTANSSGFTTLGYLAGAGTTAASHRLYFEVKVASLGSSNALGIGICNQAQLLADFLGENGFNGAGYYSNGHVVTADTVFDTYATYGVMATIGCAVDFYNQKIWWTVNGTTWNDDVITNQNPARGIGGFNAGFYDLFGGTGAWNTVYPAFGTSDTGNSAVGNFAGPFAYFMPSGFSAWDPSGASIAIPVFPTLIGQTVPMKRAVVWKTLKQESLSGKEVRVPAYSFPRYNWSVPFSLLRSALTYAEFQTLLGFINLVSGGALPFYFFDPDDNAAVAQPFGTGDGTTSSFQLSRSIGVGPLEPVQSVSGTPTITVDGTPTTAFTVSATGIVTFSIAPPSRNALAWSGSYAWLCRFDDDKTEFSAFFPQFYEVKTLSFTSIKL